MSLCYFFILVFCSRYFFFFFFFQAEDGIRDWSVTGVQTCALPIYPGARTVKYSQQDIISVRAKLRFSTLIVLPQNEEILDYATGDKEFWIINGAHNLCYVHPAEAGIRSDRSEERRVGKECRSRWSL